jgi:hypothetical protein
MLYKIIRWTRQLRIWLGGNKDREERFKLFQISPRIGSLDFRRKLIPLGYQENLFSHTYKHQIFTVRKLDPDGKHQYHLRYYSDGWVTGHWEYDYFIYQKEHLASKDLRELTKKEIAQLKVALIWKDL